MTIRFAVPALITVLALPSPARSQEQRAGPVPDRSRVIEVARDIMEGARFCTLVTIGEDGQPQARIVEPFPAEDDMAVWIGTSALTRKVGQIERDPSVTLLYFDAARSAYVTLLGTAAVITDPAEKAKRWNEAWSNFYSDRNRGEDYVLIRVRPTRLEVVSPAHGVLPDARTWRPVIIEFREPL